MSEGEAGFSPTTIVDCRWLGYSGVGRVTELFLTGLADLRPPGRWLLWGPQAVGRWADGGSRVHLHDERSPLGRLGQHTIPATGFDRALFLHLVRPLRVGAPVVVLAHDTIPVRFAEPAWKRPLQRAFYAVSARRAKRVLAYSDATVERLVADLGLERSRVDRIALTVDERLSDRVRAVRRPGPALLYVGLDRPQKNLDRAIAGFARSRLAGTGGRFVLVGLQPDAVRRVEAVARTLEANIDVRGRVSEDDLVEHYATAAAVIVPSLEEGFGLPVVEALLSEVPVCASSTGAVGEAAAGCAELFDPQSIDDIAAAIDRAVDPRTSWEPRFQLYRQRFVPLSPAAFAAQFVDALDRL